MLKNLKFQNIRESLTNSPVDTIEHLYLQGRRTAEYINELEKRLAKIEVLHEVNTNDITYE